MMFISKGIPYNKFNDVWKDGQIISLTNNQKLFWNFMYGKIVTYDDILKYSLELIRKNIIISKTTLNQTITQLKELNLISYTNGLLESDEFILIFKNKIKILKECELCNFEKKVYDFIKNYDNISLMDFLAKLDDLKYDKLTNGYDEDYIKFVYNNTHSKTLLNTVKKFLKLGICYIL